MHRLLSLLAVFVAFTAYSVWVVLGHGYTGFIELALAESWGMQMLVDLGIALVLFTFWMVPDGRARGIPTWPYLLGIVTLGSIGALGYLVHREIRELREIRAGREPEATAAHSNVRT